MRKTRKVAWYLATRLCWFSAGWLTNLGMAVAASKGIGKVRVPVDGSVRGKR